MRSVTKEKAKQIILSNKLEEYINANKYRSLSFWTSERLEPFKEVFVYAEDPNCKDFGKKENIDPKVQMAKFTRKGDCKTYIDHNPTQYERGFFKWRLVDRAEWMSFYFD